MTKDEEEFRCKELERVLKYVNRVYQEKYVSRRNSIPPRGSNLEPLGNGADNVEPCR